MYGLSATTATDLAEEIQRRYPVMEMLRYTQSGEEYSISVAHTEADIEETLNITEDVLGTIKEKM